MRNALAAGGTSDLTPPWGHVLCMGSVEYKTEDAAGPTTDLL